MAVAMDDNKLRQLERQFKLRVKTGCETCRIRRVKCDETKPECNRCTKTGRRCEGYRHVARTNNSSASLAASIRNSSFLVVPQRPSVAIIPRNPSRSLSPEASENRSFFYFQNHTLPKWTEFFDSELWSQKILQLSHSVPAIKHGVLALSTLHERFESTTPIFSTQSSDFAFAQYAQAVSHSNDLLTAHQRGRVDLEKVLIACVIFVCYENLAGNYRQANMHLRNGLRIFSQHKLKLQGTPAEDAIANVLYRFDLQAMTFSDNASPYDYRLDDPPECPQVPHMYTENATARNDLVGLLRCMMWISGVANINPHAPEHPVWLQIYTRLMGSFEAWESTFSVYQQNVPPHEQGNPKIYAGNTLLKIYAIMARIVVAAGAGLRTELSWDSFDDSFKTIIDLAETLPVLNPTQSRSSSHASSSPPGDSPGNATALPTRTRNIAPNPATTSTTPSPGASAFSLSSEPSPQLRSPTPGETPGGSKSKKKPSSFSPSFELSPIVPLFVTACRCRDPVLRRRAIAVLLNCRRREGVWDSVGAGMVALQCLKLEEGIGELVELGPDNWLPLSPKCRDAADIPERRRVQDVFVSVNAPERQIGVNYLLRSGESFDRYVKF